MTDETTEPTPVPEAPAPAPEAVPATQDPAQLASDFKKDELQTAAAVQGVEVPSGATKADIAEALVDQSTPPAAAVVVDNHTARSDDDAHLGSWVDVVSGEYTGRFGAYVSTVSSDSTGYPEQVIIRTRDADNLLLEVAYSDLRPSDSNGGR
jgi:hypothetical protein